MVKDIIAKAKKKTNERFVKLLISSFNAKLFLIKYPRKTIAANFDGNVEVSVDSLHCNSQLANVFFVLEIMQSSAINLYLKETLLTLIPLTKDH
ncbi:hypothetical protein FF38_06681 [Lucilia cuprina]|uniref:Uncharacterized protein n=1 Tax=Lucilia cuprina TaxID=7375 RepID=A0A0L0C1N8_LUCCU|nr:hypothetical protein FF38_06681 [Lucilia cuprina]